MAIATSISMSVKPNVEVGDRLENRGAIDLRMVFTISRVPSWMRNKRFL
jgi:hypothetical protein